MTSSDIERTRRWFLKTIAAWAIAPRHVLAGPSSPQMTVHLDESGSPGTSTPFVVGALSCSSPSIHRKKIAEIRRNTGFRQRLRYASSNRHKLKFTYAVLDYVRTSRDLRFSALAFEPSENVNWPHDPREAEVKYFSVYRRVLADVTSAPRGVSCDIYTERHQRSGADALLHRHLAETMRSVKKITLVEESEDDLMQIAGFLAGCVYGERSGTADKVKRELIGAGRRSLRTGSLLDPAMEQRRDFRVTVVR